MGLPDQLGTVGADSEDPGVTGMAVDALTDGYLALKGHVAVNSREGCRPNFAVRAHVRKQCTSLPPRRLAVSKSSKDSEHHTRLEGICMRDNIRFSHILSGGGFSLDTPPLFGNPATSPETRGFALPLRDGLAFIAALPSRRPQQVHCYNIGRPAYVPNGPFLELYWQARVCPATEHPFRRYSPNVGQGGRSPKLHRRETARR
jgi:hypothetical protein